MSKLTVMRGSIWAVDLDPTRGHEQGKKRPCLVLSAEDFNVGPTELAVIAPLTSQYRPLSWLVPLEPPEGGIIKRSYIICNQLRMVSLERFSSCSLGTIKSTTMEKVEILVRMLLVL
jgi:mRNA interferase MazF